MQIATMHFYGHMDTWEDRSYRTWRTKQRFQKYLSIFLVLVDIVFRRQDSMF